MHLNNKGWGTIQMILMILFLFLLLGITWYFISSLYNGQLARNSVGFKEGYYEEIKENLKDAAQRYYRDHNINGQALLSYDMLKSEGYISNVQDFFDASCTGYVTVNNDVFKPYIKCKNYTSNGYISDYE